jgi:hypothetical protein
VRTVTRVCPRAATPASPRGTDLEGAGEDRLEGVGVADDVNVRPAEERCGDFGGELAGEFVTRRVELEDGTDDRGAGGAADLEDVRALEIGGGAVLELELEDEREGVAGGDVDGERGGSPI